MKKIILDLAMSLDAFMEGKNKEVDWITFDDEIGAELSDFADEIDTVLYGRVSYELFGNYIPPDEASPFEKAFYNKINQKSKYVFSTQPITVHPGDNLIQDDIVGAIQNIRAKAQKDIWLFGGAGLISSLLNLDLVDEIRIGVNPVILGEGNPVFKHIRGAKKLDLIKTKVYQSGVIGLYYRPVAKTT